MNHVEPAPRWRALSSTLDAVPHRTKAKDLDGAPPPDGQSVWVHVGYEDKSQSDGYSLTARYILGKKGDAGRFPVQISKVSFEFSRTLKETILGQIESIRRFAFPVEGTTDFPPIGTVGRD